MAMDTVDKVLLGLGVVAIGAAVYFIVDPGKGSADSGEAEKKAAAKEPRKPLPAPKGANSLERLRDHVRTLATLSEVEDQFVEVQHILIGFNDNGTESVPQKGITRSKLEAEQLAADLFERARNGEDFGKLVEQHTNDSPPGIYGMVLDPAKVAQYPGASPRGRMVAAFGNTGWRLNPGEVGVSAFDQTASPFGWHIIKRLK